MYLRVVAGSLVDVVEVWRERELLLSWNSWRRAQEERGCAVVTYTEELA